VLNGVRAPTARGIHTAGGAEVALLVCFRCHTHARTELCSETSAIRVLQVDFFAKDELITIIPNFSLPTHGSTCSCITVTTYSHAVSHVRQFCLTSSLSFSAGRVWTLSTEPRIPGAALASPHIVEAQKVHHQGP
jgi:hypothetical protein